MSVNDRKQEQLMLSFLSEEEPSQSGIVTPKTTQGTEDLVFGEHTMEEICEEENMKKAMKKVMQNNGKPGVDRMKTEELPGFLREHWLLIRSQLLSGTYKPLPVKQVEIPKPTGGVRKLGIPTAVDRVVQQAILQVLQSKWDPTFSENSFGFRPGRSAHQAIEAAQNNIEEGYNIVVDIDLEKFFDRVNHDALMGRIRRKVKDKRLLKTLRSFLNTGFMDGKTLIESDEGTPQGGPLSPLLSNIMLDDLDKELEKRGLRFCRYADDCNIYVRSPRAGKRIMKSIELFISKKLKLRINREKSAVAKATERKFLGFTFYEKKKKKGKARIKRMIASESIKRFKQKIRRMTHKKGGMALNRIIENLRKYLRGWLGYFGFTEVKHQLRQLDGWIRRRLRAVIWMQWKTSEARRKGLLGQGVLTRPAESASQSDKGPWRMSAGPAMQTAFPIHFFDTVGLPRLNKKPNT